MDCNVGTFTTVPIWRRMDVSQFAHVTVLHMTLPFDSKERSYQGEGGIPIWGTYLDTNCNNVICTPPPPALPCHCMKAVDMLSCAAPYVCQATSAVEVTVVAFSASIF